MFAPMPTHTNTHIDKPSGHPAGLLLGLTGALLALLILNLAVFDDLRIDPSAGVLETFTKPQHLSSLVAVLIAGALVAFKHRSAARVAVVVAWIEIAAFAFFHVIPVEVGPSKPYWGDGMGDPLQWVGLLSILAVSAAIVRVARRSTAQATVSPAAPSDRHFARPTSRHDRVINLEPATAAGSCRFLSIALWLVPSWSLGPLSGRRREGLGEIVEQCALTPLRRDGVEAEIPPLAASAASRAASRSQAR